MLFHSLDFFLLFAGAFTVYWLLRQHRLRVAWLVLVSCVFYMSWNPWFILLIFGTTLIDYVVALKLNSLRSRAGKRTLLMVGVSLNLLVLVFFKYLNFAMQSSGWGLSLIGVEWNAPIYGIILPLGISFYTFEAISYIVDVYRGRVKPVRNILDYLSFILFFPHLIAGPIVRPHHFLPQVGQTKRFSWTRFQLGAQLFLMGLVKKSVIGDNIAGIVDPVFADPAAYSSTATWLAVVGYAVQIYCDFSGYSDMAIGIAHTLGFKLPRNFNMPYFASNIAEFWSRWHISLSTWLRDYLYIPLGGNRHGQWKTCRNLLITMLLGGLWHGAAWTFVAWGLLHGILLVGHRLWTRLKPESTAIGLKPLAVAFTFLCVCIGWVFFRSHTFGGAWDMLGRMFIPATGKNLEAAGQAVLLVVLAVVFISHLLGTFVDLKKWMQRIPSPAMGAALACTFILAQILTPEDVKAFIYFQF